MFEWLFKSKPKRPEPNIEWDKKKYIAPFRYYRADKCFVYINVCEECGRMGHWETWRPCDPEVEDESTANPCPICGGKVEESKYAAKFTVVNGVGGWRGRDGKLING